MGDGEGVYDIIRLTKSCREQGERKPQHQSTGATPAEAQVDEHLERVVQACRVHADASTRIQVSAPQHSLALGEGGGGGRNKARTDGSVEKIAVTNKTARHDTRRGTHQEVWAKMGHSNA